MSELENFAVRPTPGWRPIARRRCGGRWLRRATPSGAAATPNSRRSRSASGSSGCATRAGPCRIGRRNTAVAGLDPEQAKIVRQEMAAIGARQPLTSFGISMLGPALLHYGTEAQKKDICLTSRPDSFAGARAIPSRMPDRISPRCRPAPRATATISSSAARRSGRRMRTTPTGSFAWCVPTRQPRSMTASASSCST